MWKCAQLSLLKDKCFAQPVKVFLLKRQMSDENELDRNNKIKMRAAWSKQMQMLIKKRDSLEKMNLDIQQQQLKTEAKIRLNKKQLQEATDKWNKLNKSSKTP